MEAHRFASDSFRYIFRAVKYKFILCLTATIERLDGKEEIIKKYAPVCDTITMEEAIANGWVSPIKSYVVLLEVDLTDYNEYCRAFNSAFALFGWDFNLAMSMKDYKVRLAFAKQTKMNFKDITAAYYQFMKYMRLRKEFIYNHPKKIEVCRKILDARKDKKCITFSATIKDAEALKRGVTLHSEKKKAENKAILEAFNKADSGVICSSKALNEGVDVKGLSVGVRMYVNSSKITSVQISGRICRFEPNKEAEMFTLILKGTQEEKWFQNSNTTEYQVINENQLDSVLIGEKVETRRRDNQVDTTYRF